MFTKAKKITKSERKAILKDHTHFGTDMADFAWDFDGSRVITSGGLYGIDASQYNENSGDITRAKAKAILKNCDY